MANRSNTSASASSSRSRPKSSQDSRSRRGSSGAAAEPEPSEVPSTRAAAAAAAGLATGYNVRDYQNPDAGAADRPLTKAAAKGKDDSKAKKGGISTLQSILGNTGPSVVRELTSHFSNLIREYSQDGEVLQASNLNSWWSETQQVAASPKMLTEYIKEYFRKYSGRGLPVTVDVLIATRCASSLGGEGGVTREELKEIREMAKTAKAEAAAAKNELNQVKQELNRLKNQNGGKGGQGGGGSGSDDNIKCNFCSEKGHRWANCPKRAAAAAKGDGSEQVKDE